MVQFKEDFLGERFFQLPEFQSIQSLLIKALRGLHFKRKTRDTLRDRLHNLTTLNAPSAVLELISILILMAGSEDFNYLNAETIKSTAHEKALKKSIKLICTLSSISENPLL